MSDTITLTGLVATPPKHIVTSEGCPMLLVPFRHGGDLREAEPRQRR